MTSLPPLKLNISGSFFADLDEIKTSAIDTALPLIAGLQKGDLDVLAHGISQLRNEEGVQDFAGGSNGVQLLSEALDIIDAVRTLEGALEKSIKTPDLHQTDRENVLGRALDLKTQCKKAVSYYSPIRNSKVREALGDFHKNHDRDIDTLITTVAQSLPYSSNYRSGTLTEMKQLNKPDSKSPGRY